MASTKEKEKKTTDTYARKWILTVNNPVDHNLTHDVIKLLLAEFNGCVYWCMADEIGLVDKTYHTHIYIHSKSVIRFSAVKKRFPSAHIEVAKGTALDNYHYCGKTGKWETDPKVDTRVENTFEEWGELPVERQGARNDIADLYSMVKEGMSNYEILEASPTYLLQIDKIERARQVIKDEQYSEVFRELTVSYIYGDAGSGKSRTIMETHGYKNVYRITDYDHPFDGYKGQDVIVFEEFYSGHIKISDMLNYLDGYPLELPCRYANKIACFTKVYLVSNIPFGSQYQNVRHEHPETYNAFCRRVHKIIHYIDGQQIDEPVPDSDTVFTKTDKNDIPFNND